MNRSVLVTAALLAALAVGIGIGYLVGRNNPGERGLAENPTVLKPGETGPDWKEWKYPGSADHESGQAGGGLDAGVRSPMHYDLVMTTKDDYEKVLGFYAEKTGLSLVDNDKGSGVGGGNHELWFVANDSSSPNDVTGVSQEDRPVKTKLFGKRTPAYDLTMFISRAKDEKNTHIVLVYDLKK